MSRTHHQYLDQDMLPPLHAWLPSSTPVFPLPTPYIQRDDPIDDIHNHHHQQYRPSQASRRLPSISDMLNPIEHSLPPLSILPHDHVTSFEVTHEHAMLSPATSSAASTHTPEHVEGDRRQPQSIEVKGECLDVHCHETVKHRGYCKQHGGARRCAVAHCAKGVQGGSLCIGHGGGKRCRIPDCNKATQSQGLCKAHGGGVRCKFEGCNKSSQGGGFCRRHGGGKRCSVEGCPRGAQRGSTCAQHGGKSRCLVDECVRADRGGGFCEVHRRGKVCTLSYCNRLAKAGQAYAVPEPTAKKLHRINSVPPDCVRPFDSTPTLPITYSPPVSAPMTPLAEHQATKDKKHIQAGNALVEIKYTQPNGERKLVKAATESALRTSLSNPAKYRRQSICSDLHTNLSMAFTVDVLAEPVTHKLMIQFADKIPYAPQRLLFWADAQHLRTLPSSQYTDKVLRKIYDKFLSPSAATPICVPTGMLKVIRAAFNSPNGIQSAGKDISLVYVYTYGRSSVTLFGTLRWRGSFTPNCYYNSVS
ncbi:hypothetical protein B5M09_005732 [Aphanomyces astaci]|uniref:RGS domain-containing protein n=1 Tax=Aphanomyces astaci TaxID=112090 RepID=A0A425D1E2_APHAT|nr:hypothetical protein B5M09_005732 [Aphanomyces astaci]